MLRSFREVRAAAKSHAGFRMAVVASEDEASLRAAAAARREGLAESVLLGRRGPILEGLERIGADPRDFQIQSVDSEEEAAAEAVALARAGAVQVILKGRLPTSTLLRAVLARDTGLRTGRILSDVRLFDHPFKKEGFLAVTDGGVIPAPTLEQKRAILENAVWVYHRLGWMEPKVAMLCATEKVLETMPHTVEARRIRDWNREGVITGCVVEGPISLDLALIRESARAKGYASPVAGEADILVGPTIEAVNILGKGLVYFKGCVPGQVVVGSKVPVLIPSRSDGPEVKLNSIALAAAIGLA